MRMNCGLKSELRAVDGRLMIASTMSLSRIASVLLLLFLAPSVWAQTPHPRIWLDSATMTRLTALKNANDATWVALKATADADAALTVEAYSQSSCTGSDICYVYEGYGWYNAVLPLALAYQMTGSTTYSNQVKAILNAFSTAGSSPCKVDQGYPSRSAVLALAIGYDWIYPTLSSTDKTNYTTVLDACWTWVQASGYLWNTTANPYSNYFGGHLLGYGLAALAVEGDDANSASMQTAILNEFNNNVVPTFTTTGGFTGGFPVEGYNYGFTHFIRIFQYMLAMKTAGKTDLFTTYTSWMKTAATHFIYDERPDNWAVNDEGDWPASVTRILYQIIPVAMAGLLNGSNEGGWMVHLNANLATPPHGIVASAFDGPATWESFFYNRGQADVDYTATQPVYFYSPGDEHTIVRTDWTTSAVHTTFHGGVVKYADHDSHAAGHLAIQRGADYLLINAAEWQGVDGVVGNPNTTELANWHLNTLFYWDQGTSCRAIGGAIEGQFAGCQMNWATPNTVKHKEGTGYAIQEAPLQNAYAINADSGNTRTLSNYVRSYVNINDVSFVFDRITAPSTSLRKLEWHTSALNSASPAGVATALSLSGGLGTVTVGSSKLWINTLLPAFPTISQIADNTTWASGTNMATQRFEVSDPNASSCSTNCLFLTVLAPTASTVSSMPTATLINTNKYKGGFYNDGTLPRIALFSTDGTAQTSVTYTATYSSALTGRHVILDLVPGTYNVTKDGTSIYSGLIVSSDGSLNFTTAGGTNYAITQTSGSPAMRPLQPPTGLGGTAR
jgi:Heparinase II C-terminal domain